MPSAKQRFYDNQAKKGKITSAQAQSMGASLKNKSSSKASSSSSGFNIPKVDTRQLEALQGKYNETLAPTADELGTETQLGNIITSKELGVAKVEQEPMAQGFVTGQGAALEKSAALKSLPLQTKLANLQARRQSAADVLKAQLGFETSNVDRQTQLAESARSRALAQSESNKDRAFQEKSFAESQRQFNVSESRAGKSSGSKKKPTLYESIDDAFNSSGGDWDKTAKILQRNYDVSSGSAVDNELRRRFGLAPVTTKKSSGK
jgi:hypothetical protein